MRSSTSLFVTLAIHGMRSSFLQHQSSKPSIFLLSAFFRVQLSHPYMIIGKKIARTSLHLVARPISLLFQIFSMFSIVLRLSAILLFTSEQSSPPWSMFEPRKVVDCGHHYFRLF
uniref:Uncharacterized protein n=1 Tax=Erpetoichthys calabaricus TaxID=27687 RepID=A0A8C4SUJ7_ERPCA